jgi:hypothetical protein
MSNCSEKKSTDYAKCVAKVAGEKAAITAACTLTGAIVMGSIGLMTAGPVGGIAGAKLGAAKGAGIGTGIGS